MKRLTHNLGAKIMAIVLFVLLAALSAGSFVGIVLAWEENMYDRDNVTFEETSMCRSLVYSMADEIVDIYEWDSAQIPEMFSKENTNLSFRISETSAAERPAVQNYWIEGSAYADEIEWHYTLDVSETMDTTGAVTHTYVIQYALNEDMLAHDGFYWSYMLFELVYTMRYMMIFFAVFGALAAISMLVFLCAAAGHRKGTDAVVLNYQDRVPYDLYLGIVCFLCFIDVQIYVENSYYMFTIFEIIFGTLAVLAVALLFIATLMTTAARIKAGTLWKNTILYRLMMWCVKYLKKFWVLLVHFFHMLPLIWRTVLVTLVLIFGNVILFPMAVWGAGMAAFLLVLFYAVVFLLVCGIAVQLRKLQKAGEMLAAGNADYKVDTGRMYWDFKQHGENLNSIGNGIAIAVDERTRSERLKTELITNVSHDIKTPLTSIINYVDLLKKEHTPEEGEAYIEVLSRQSQRLKKLTDDLVEASKASSGNVAVLLKKTNVLEMVNQAIGEYEERFQAAKLEPVVSIQPVNIEVMADGRLLWRILDNLLNNVCKYSQPDTRVYIDVRGSGKEVVFSVKNISREKLNINADELTERFVRGDSSRNTEGSGLGLNIAKSLTELQNGQFELSIDGDLFKAELRFKSAS